MVRWLIGLFGAAVERDLRQFLLAAAAAAVVGLLAAISLAFGTFAAYACLAASQGRTVAALILCAAYGLLAAAIGAIGWMACRRAGPPRRAVTAPAPAPPGNIESLLQSLATAGTPEDQLALVAAIRLGHELSPMRILAMALIGGFIAGRNFGK